MNDIARPLLLPTSATAAPTPAALPVQSPPRRVADLPGAEREPDIGLTWRRLDRLSAAARLGVILASPRTALLIDQTLGSRIPATAPGRSRLNTARQRPGAVR